MSGVQYPATTRQAAADQPMPLAAGAGPLARQIGRFCQFTRLGQRECLTVHFPCDAQPVFGGAGGAAGQNPCDRRGVGLPQRIANEQHAPRPKDANHFSHSIETPRKVMQKRIGDDGIESKVGVRQRTGVGPVDENHVSESRSMNFPPRPLKNSGPAIDANDFNPGLPCANLDRDSRRSGSHVKDARPHAGLWGKFKHREKCIGK
jgi:hypothetical protein